MREFVPALDSEYIIDGARMELTPRQILEEAVGGFHRSHPAANLEHDDYQIDTDKPNRTAAEPLIDESVDPSPGEQRLFIGKDIRIPRRGDIFHPQATQYPEILPGRDHTCGNRDRIDPDYLENRPFQIG